MKLNPQDNSELKYAFTSDFHADALVAVEVLPQNPHWCSSFDVRVDDEVVSIPHRVYHNAASIKTDKLNDLQKSLVDCILTRHHDGFVRQNYLTRIARSNYVWVPPFVIQLLGEYVVEILRDIETNLGNMDTAFYAQFLRANSAFLALTEQRVISYWDC